MRLEDYYCVLEWEHPFFLRGKMSASVQDADYSSGRSSGSRFILLAGLPKPRFSGFIGFRTGYSGGTAPGSDRLDPHGIPYYAF